MSGCRGKYSFKESLLTTEPKHRLEMPMAMIGDLTMMIAAKEEDAIVMNAAVQAG